MNAAWCWGIREARRRARALVALALLVGLSAAVVLGVVAGARRTASSLDRFRDATATKDAVAQIEGLASDEIDALVADVRGLPMVDDLTLVHRYPADVGSEFEAAITASADGRFGTAIEQGRVLEGRRPDPAVADEVLLNETAARALSAGPGDVIEVGTFTPDDLDCLIGGTCPFPGLRGPLLRLQVVGVARFVEDMMRDPTYSAPGVIATPAFQERYGESVGGFGGLVGVRLRDGDRDYEAFRFALGDTSIGSTVRFTAAGTATDEDVAMTVVGRVLLPTFEAVNPSAGAWFTPGGLEDVARSDGSSNVLIRLAGSADASAVQSELEDLGLTFSAYSRTEVPGEIANLEGARSLPWWFAAFCAVLGTASLLHALVVTVRRRRRELAVLRALGFGARDVRVAIGWQARTLLAAAAAIGIPIGLMIGRFVWEQVASGLGVATDAALPMGLLVLAIVGGLLGSWLLALVPSRRVVRPRPAAVLRTE